MALPNNYTLGRGEIHFGRFASGNFENNPGFRYLGNTPEFQLTIQTEMLDHFSSDRGIREKDQSVAIETTRQGSLVTDNINPDNVSLFFFGNKATLAQTSAVGTVESFPAVVLDNGLQLGISATNPTGVRSVSNVVVKVGVTTYVLNTDYTLDAELGLVTILESGAIAAGANVDITYDRAAKSRVQIISGTQPIEGALRFISYNAEGDKFDYYMPHVKLSPNGDYNLKSDEWQQIPLNIEILKPADREAIYIDGRPFIP